MTPSWYDVLGVDDTATPDEIRTAWQDGIAGLDATDRRFKQRNRAAEVLLDPARRAAHDRDLAAQDEDDEDLEDVEDVPATDDVEDVEHVEHAEDVDDAKDVDSDEVVAVRPRAKTALAPRATDSTDGTDSTDPVPARRGIVLTLVLAALALVLVVATVVALVAGGGSSEPAATDDGGLPDARAVAAARKAAETAIGPVLSYDYRDLDKSTAAATSFMTPDYAETYRKNFSGFVEDNAPTTKTIVTADVVSSGVVRTGEGRVDVLVFVNRPIRNAAGDKVSRDQVTVRMLDDDGTWLVDCLITAPGDSCGG